MGQSKFSYELTFCFISFNYGGKQKSKSTFRVEINKFRDDLHHTIRSSTKSEGLSYPTHFLKSRGY